MLLRCVTWILASTFLLFCPNPTMGQDIEVRFVQINTLDGRGGLKTEFLPGEAFQVQVGLSVLRSTGSPFDVRLRITGDGWHQIPSPQTLTGSGPRLITFGGSVPGEASPGKVSLLVDVFSEQETVSLQGRRHGYLGIGCPEGLPAGMAARLTVGRMPVDMAVTGNGRYLYVTSEENRKITVIDVETKAVVTEIEDPETIGWPRGVEPSVDGAEMFVADAAFQSIHVIDANDHVWLERIRLNPDGELGVVSPGDLAVNGRRNQIYVADSRAPRIFIVDWPSRNVRPPVYLFRNPLEPPRGLNPIQLLPDPDNPRFLYVLCGTFSEVIRLDTVSGAIVDFVQLRSLQDLDPTRLWPVWSMALNRARGEIYVVMNPGGFESTYPTIESKIHIFQKNRLWAGGRELSFGSSIWDLVVREDQNGRFVYAIDSYRGEILVIDMNTETELYRCAVPVRPGGRLLRADLDRNRLFVGNWTPGYVDIVE